MKKLTSTIINNEKKHSQAQNLQTEEQILNLKIKWKKKKQSKEKTKMKRKS